MKVQVKTHTQAGIGNTKLVKRTGGYSLAPENIGLKPTDYVFLAYLTYRASLQGNAYRFVYDPTDVNIWEDVNMTRKSYEHRIANLVEAKFIEKETVGSLRIYKLLKADKVVKIPAGLLLNKLFTWDEKVTMVALHIAATHTGTTFISVSTKHATESKTGITHSKINKLISVLLHMQWAEIQTTGVVIDIDNILERIQENTVTSLYTTLLNMRSYFKNL